MRILIFAVPILAAWFVIHLVADDLYRPAGLWGLGLWAVQAIAVTSVTALAADRVAGRFLPLATVLGLSLTFPDQAPSRFGVAMRSSTLKKLSARVANANENGLSSDVGAAANEAIELVTMLSRHERLTRGHTERVRAYCDLIAIEMGLSEAEREKLAWAALLHDIGKLSVRPEILNKAGRPSEEEWMELRNHPKAGEELIEPLRDWLGDWALATSQHHERWDGDGYPYGLKGTEISLAGRIVAVADAYDVITSKRSYKVGLPVETARRELVACSGTQFDPAVVRAFLRASLSKRRSYGPLAGLLELPGLPGVIHGVTSVQTSIASVAAVTAAVTMLPPMFVPDEAPEVAAFIETTVPSLSAESTGASATVAPTTTTTAPSSTAPATTASSTTASSTTASSTTGPSTTAPATTAPPTTAPPTTTLATTTEATTTTTAATTTSQPTTTTSQPTTTTQPPGGPEAVDDSGLALLGSGSFDVLVNDRPISAPLDLGSFIITSPPAIGTATIVGDRISYSGGNLLGSTSLVYQICDTNGLCDTATVTIQFLL